jgi:hypothetical protein
MNRMFCARWWPAWRSVMVFLCLASIVAGCSQGTGIQTADVGTGGTGTLPTSVSGKVADGYLVSATVFLDKNGNYQLDAGEPSTTTDVNGAYTLKVDPADVGKFPIVALVIQGVTLDKDTNQPVAATYVLSMPKDSVHGTSSDNFISPLTSLVREMMETGIYNSVSDATDALLAKMGLPAGSNVMGDYLATPAADLHAAAQNIANLMGSQMGQIIGTDGSATTVDINRYRSMMGTVFSSMPSIMGAGQAGASGASTMSDLSSSMTTTISHLPPTGAGQPYRNMSTSFRGMTGGMK